jgi:aldehyde:ferredoxin oxidoreductase
MKVTAISPNGLTNNSGMGGHFPAALKMAGYDSLVVEGKSERPVYLYIDQDRVEFRAAGHLMGLDTKDTQEAIKAELGDSVKVACIGSTGEKLVHFSGIMTGPGSAAGRNGFGAIMGSKNLKAVAARGRRRAGCNNLDRFASACREAYQWMPESCDLLRLQHKGGHGDKYSLDYYRDVYMMPLGNYTDYGTWAEMKGQDEGPEKFYEKYATRPQYGCFGCPVHHFHIFEIPGRSVGPTKCAQWESFYSQVWNKDRRVIVQANALCQKYGLDSGGACLAVAFLMDLYHRGIITEKETDGLPMKMGDERAILTAVEKMGRQEGFGRLFREGVLGAAREIGRGAEDYAMQVNGQNVEPYEYRVLKSWALCAATTDGSISHSMAYLDLTWVLDRDNMEKMGQELYGSKRAARTTDYGYKGVIVYHMGNKTTAGDLIGTCKWAWPWGINNLEVPARLFSLATGREMSEEDLKFAAHRVLTLERAWRSRKGLGRDNMPPWLFESPVTYGPFKGETLHRDGFNNMLDDYYDLMGWDQEGRPETETFKKFGLTAELDRFRKDLGRRDKKSA